MDSEVVKKVLKSVVLGKPQTAEPAIEERLREDYEIALWLLPDKEKAEQAVTIAWAKTKSAVSALLDNQRSRYEAATPRASYRPLNNEAAVRRQVLLGEIRRLQMKAEAIQLPQDDNYWYRCFCQEIATLSLNRTSFQTAVSMTQIFHNYPAPTTLRLYDSIANNRSATKDSSSVSRIKKSTMTHLEKRFGDLLRVTYTKKSYRFKERPATEQEIRSISILFQHLLPPPPNQDHLVPSVIQGIIPDENVVEMTLHRNLTDIDTFNKIASNVGVTPEENIFLIPEFSGIAPDGPGPGSATPVPASDLDLNRIKNAIIEEQNKQSRTVPRAYIISVDGVERGSLDIETHSTSLLLEDGANVVEVIGVNDDDKRVNLATYVLTYDGMAKTERWNIQLGNSASHGLQRLDVDFQYSADDMVSAKLHLVSDLPICDKSNVAKIGSHDSQKLSTSPDKPNVVTNEPILKRIVICGKHDVGKSTFVAAVVSYFTKLRHRLVVPHIFDNRTSEITDTSDYDGTRSSGFTGTLMDLGSAGCMEDFAVSPAVTVVNLETDDFKKLTLWDMPGVDNVNDILAWRESMPSPDLAIGVIEFARYNRREVRRLIASLKKLGASAVSIVLAKRDTLPKRFVFNSYFSALKKEVEVKALLKQSGYSLRTGSIVVSLSALDIVHGETKWNSKLDKLVRAFNIAGWSMDNRNDTFTPPHKKNLGVSSERKKGGIINESIDQCAEKQSKLVQAFLDRAAYFGIAQDPAPRICQKHDRLSRLFSVIALVGLVIMLGTADICISANMPAVRVVTLLFAEITMPLSFFLLSRRWGWSRRLYEEYRALDRTITEAKVRLEETRVNKTGRVNLIEHREDWRGFAIAQALYASLVGPHAGHTPLSKIHLCDLLCSCGIKLNKAMEIVDTIMRECTDESGVLQHPRQLSLLLIKELGLTKQAGWALEESMNLPPVELAFDGDTPAQLIHEDIASYNPDCY
ncbi:MAG TPA: hypothetical protein VHA33_22130 [Candidatus Angelobacter sp.]|jgi:hypothetical protein|nr:hypothetical protein [Candidatus Angelobacter sp.]